MAAGKDEYSCNGIPGVIATPKGAVLAFVGNRKSAFNHVGDLDTLVARRFNAGTT